VPGVYHIRLFTPGIGDISTLQKRGHFYFALTGLCQEFWSVE
jgi:hypothetical protein